MLKKLEATQVKVGKWSRANFGRQASHIIPIIDEDDIEVCLESLVPLLGIGEEIGELTSAVRHWEGQDYDDDEVRDALGDIGVYLCDFASREGFQLAYVSRYLIGLHIEEPGLGINEAYGKLCHAVLKRHQGIRGFDDDQTYFQHRNEAVAHLLANLIAFTRQVMDESFVEIVADVFEEVVASRDWKEHAAVAAGLEPPAD